MLRRTSAPHDLLVLFPALPSRLPLSHAALEETCPLLSGSVMTPRAGNFRRHSGRQLSLSRAFLGKKGVATYQRNEKKIHEYFYNVLHKIIALLTLSSAPSSCILWDSEMQLKLSPTCLALH